MKKHLILWGSLLSLTVYVACQSISAGAGPADDRVEMARQAEAFLASLPDSLKPLCQRTFADTGRTAWHFFPMERSGVPLRQLDAPQREKLFALLESGLSAAGLEKMRTIMSLEGVLRVLEERAPDDTWRDPEGYFLTIFGSPDADAPWSWRFEGHHVSLNYTSVGGGRISATPNFMGSNPALVKSGPAEGREALQAEEEMGRVLYYMLDAAQQAQVMIRDTAPREIVTFVDQRVQMDRYEGLSAADMTADQQAALRALIELYIGRATDELGAAYWARIDSAGLDKLYLGWAGGVDRGEPIYYRVHGPTLLLEYDNVQNGANHAHSVWRDPDRDFAYDWLLEHHLLHPDHQH